MNGKINDKQKSDDRTIEEQTSEDRHLTKINSWRTAWRLLWRNFSLTKISCYTCTVEKYGIHRTCSSHKLDVGSNFNANATCRKFAWHRCTPLGSCKDQVLVNRHRPAVDASLRAATFSVGSIWPVTLPRPCMTQTKKLYNLNWGVSTLTCHARVGRVVLRTSCMLWTSPLSCIAVSNTSTVLSLELPSVVSLLYTSKSAGSVTSITVSLLWSGNSYGMVCCSCNTNNPSWHLSELEVLLLNACCLHNRWMIDPLRNCTQSPNLSTRRFFSWKVRHSEAPLHAREVLTWIYHTKKLLIHYTEATHRLRHIQDILLYETSHMLKRRTVRTWRNIMISNCSPVCTVSLELRLALFFNFVERAGLGVQAWKMPSSAALPE